MRLSKQERIAVLVIAVIIILGLGIFLFIVPQFQNIATSNTQLAEKQKELTEAQNRANTREQLGQDVLAAYEDGQNIADMFFEEMKPYEADNQIRAFIQYCKDNGVNCSVDSLTINSAGVSELGVTFNTESEITYDLKSFAQGNSSSEGDSEEAQRTAILQEALSNTEAVGSISVSFTVTTLEPDDLLKFIDTINDYEVDGVRKAIKLTSGIKIEYSEIQQKYDEIVDDMELDLNYDALAALAKANGKTAPTKDEIKAMLGLDTTSTTTATTGTDGENTVTTTGNSTADKLMDIGDDDIYSAELTLTMYSLERMQDPTDTLAEQDKMLNG